MPPCSQEERQSSVSSPLLVEMSKQTPCIAAAHSPGAGMQLGGEQAREGWGHLRAGDCAGTALVWPRQHGTEVSFWMCPGAQMGLDNPLWAALGFTARQHCLPRVLNWALREQAPVLLLAPSTPMGRFKAGPEKFSLLAATSWQEGPGGGADPRL